MNTTRKGHKSPNHKITLYINSYQLLCLCLKCGLKYPHSRWLQFETAVVSCRVCTLYSDMQLAFIKRCKFWTQMFTIERHRTKTERTRRISWNTWNIIIYILYCYKTIIINDCTYFTRVCKKISVFFIVTSYTR